MVPAWHRIQTQQSSSYRKSTGPGKAGLSFQGENSTIEWNREFIIIIYTYVIDILMSP